MNAFPVYGHEEIATLEDLKTQVASQEQLGKNKTEQANARQASAESTEEEMQRRLDSAKK